MRDSGQIAISDVAVFVGKNESGKTSILEGLQLLNRGVRLDPVDVNDDLAEELGSPEFRIVEGEFSLDPGECRGT
ncbi:MAG: ATP-binding protein [Planctomycetales bacterium]|nr:ATP-binding protein [Planctomycetales bacterium]